MSRRGRGREWGRRRLRSRAVGVDSFVDVSESALKSIALVAAFASEFSCECGALLQKSGDSYRKLSLGSRSQGGERTIERLLSVDQTCRLQRPSLYAYLADVLTAKARGDPIPSLT